MPVFNSFTRCVGRPGMILDRTPDYQLVFWAWIHGRTHNRTYHWCSWRIFDILPVGVCVTGHWQMSGRPVQELNVCTVYTLSMLRILPYMNPYILIAFKNVLMILVFNLSIKSVVDHNLIYMYHTNVSQFHALFLNPQLLSVAEIRRKYFI